MPKTATKTNGPRIVEECADVSQSLEMAANLGHGACLRGIPQTLSTYTKRDDRELAWAWDLGWREAVEEWVTRELGK